MPFQGPQIDVPGTVQGHPKVGVMLYRSAGDWEVSSSSPDPDMQVAGDDAEPSNVWVVMCRKAFVLAISVAIATKIPRLLLEKMCHVLATLLVQILEQTGKVNSWNLKKFQANGRNSARHN